MHKEHLQYLVCPVTHRPLVLAEECLAEDGRVKAGQLLEPQSGRTFPIVNFIPRFVPAQNYAANFGFEWNLHARTQHDNYSSFSASRERYEKETRWGTNLTGQSVLEVGCGAGRFTAHALHSGAMVVSFDYSNAVEANYQTNGLHPRLLIIQADLYAMPFLDNFFDKAFCFGVLQHTPHPEQSFKAIVYKLRKGGILATDIYPKNLTHWFLHTKYIVRRFVRKDDPARLYRQVKAYVDFMWPLARIIRRIPRIGYAINWRLMIADHSRLLCHATDATLKEWSYLDTFDMLSPVYDQPQTLRAFRRWHREAGLMNAEVHNGPFGITGHGVKA